MELVIIYVATIAAILAVVIGFAAMVIPNDAWTNKMIQVSGYFLTLALIAGLLALFFA